MHLSQQTEKILRVAIFDHNRLENIQYNEKVAKAREQALATIAPLHEKMKSLNRKNKKLLADYEKLTAELRRKGFEAFGHGSDCRIIVIDLKRAGGKPIPPPRLWDATKAIVSIAEADKDEGLKILAGYGVVI